MSKRKDRERFATLKSGNPSYQGFRGYGAGPSAPTPEALTALTCSVCGRRRNVTQEVAREQGDSFVCFSCTEESEVTNITGSEVEEEATSSP